MNDWKRITGLVRGDWLITDDQIVNRKLGCVGQFSASIEQITNIEDWLGCIDHIGDQLLNRQAAGLKRPDRIVIELEGYTLTLQMYLV